MVKNETRTCPCDLSQFCQERSDEEIIEFIKTNKECYSLLVNRYEKKLFRYIKRISGVINESAEDILQTVFLKVYVNLNTFNEKNKFSSWIYQIVHNETVNCWRKNVKKGYVVSLEENDFLKKNIASDENTEKKVIQKIDSGKISKALRSLDGKHREALSLRYMGELSYQEIAKKIGRPVGTVGTLINRGKKILREELMKSGFSSEML
jgi:RNA polymerase sigma-70 factor (ECF subfamily)